MNKFTLPELPYDYTALEPIISGKLLELHHTKHHNAYVLGANTATDKIAEARESGDISAVNLLTKNWTFNFAGHVNHSEFWRNMNAPVKSVASGAPGGSATDTNGFVNATDGAIGKLADAICNHFGSFEKFKAQFTAVAAGVQGSGWALLVWDDISKSLQIIALHDHQGELALGLKPIVLLDVWEHAYYLDYLNVRGDYITSWWSLVNWVDAESRFSEALLSA